MALVKAKVQRSNDVHTIRMSADREIGVINDRHADYISEAHFLQAIHRKLQMRVEQLARCGALADATEKLAISQIKGISTYEAEAEQLPSLRSQLIAVESRYQAAVGEHMQSDEDALLVRLCDTRMKILLAEGRAKRIEEECRRLRVENQKVAEDQAEQRLIIDRELSGRSAYQRRAAALLAECEGLLETTRAQVLKGYSFDDIESDRRLFRGAVEIAMVDIRRQYDHLASVVGTEMKQWYDEKASTISSKFDVEASKQRDSLAKLRAELVDVRTRLLDLENRNRLLESLIADMENVRKLDMTAAEQCVKDDELHLKTLMERYEEVIGRPSQREYSVASLREEIRRYRELIDGVGPRSRRDGSAFRGMEFGDTRVVHHRSSSSRYGAVAVQDISSGTLYQSDTFSSLSAEGQRQPTVISTLDYTIREPVTTTISSERDYSMQRSAQGNMIIAEVAPDGSYVILENTSLDFDQHLGDWTLRSTSSTLKQVSYTFPRDFVLTPLNTVQVFARGRGAHNPPHSVVCETDSTFATGDDLSIYLYDNYGQYDVHMEGQTEQYCLPHKKLSFDIAY